MSARDAEAVLKEEVGNSLRSIVFVTDEYTPIYRRDDVDQKYLQQEIEKIHDELRASSLASTYLGNTWKLGEHRCTVYLFSRGVVCHVISDSEELVVSFDDDSEIDVISIIRTCSSLLSDET